MEHKQPEKRSSSLFHFQCVKTNQRSEAVVDTGCQRCQHCMMRRRLWSAANIGLPVPNRPILEEKPEGGQVCP